MEKSPVCLGHIQLSVMIRFSSELTNVPVIITTVAKAPPSLKKDVSANTSSKKENSKSEKNNPTCNEETPEIRPFQTPKLRPFHHFWMIFSIFWTFF